MLQFQDMLSNISIFIIIKEKLIPYLFIGQVVFVHQILLDRPAPFSGKRSTENQQFCEFALEIDIVGMHSH